MCLIIPLDKVMEEVEIMDMEEANADIPYMMEVPIWFIAILVALLKEMVEEEVYRNSREF